MARRDDQGATGTTPTLLMSLAFEARNALRRCNEGSSELKNVQSGCTGLWTAAAAAVTAAAVAVLMVLDHLHSSQYTTRTSKLHLDGGQASARVPPEQK